MHVSKDSMWREIWKILQNFLETKQGQSPFPFRIIRRGLFVPSCKHGEKIPRCALIPSRTPRIDRDARAGDRPAVFVACVTSWHAEPLAFRSPVLASASFRCAYLFHHEQSRPNHGTERALPAIDRSWHGENDTRARRVCLTCCVGGWETSLFSCRKGRSET